MVKTTRKERFAYLSRREEKYRLFTPAKTVELVKQAMELTDAESQYRIPWIVFDRDMVN